MSQEIKYALPKSIPNKGKTVHSLNVFQCEGFIVYFKPVSVMQCHDIKFAIADM